MNSPWNCTKKEKHQQKHRTSTWILHWKLEKSLQTTDDEDEPVGRGGGGRWGAGREKWQTASRLWMAEWSTGGQQPLGPWQRFEKATFLSPPTCTNGFFTLVFIPYFHILHLSPQQHRSEMLFVGSVYILKAVILWNTMLWGSRTLWSSEPVLRNYWWNTDVTSASHNKCILWNTKKNGGFTYLIARLFVALLQCFNLSLTSYKPGRQPSWRTTGVCVVSMLWLIGAWRGISDHNPVRVCADQAARAQPSTCSFGAELEIAREKAMRNGFLFRCLKFGRYGKGGNYCFFVRRTGCWVLQL